MCTLPGWLRHIFKVASSEQHKLTIPISRWPHYSLCFLHSTCSSFIPLPFFFLSFGLSSLLGWGLHEGRDLMLCPFVSANPGPMSDNHTLTVSILLRWWINDSHEYNAQRVASLVLACLGTVSCVPYYILLDLPLSSGPGWPHRSNKWWSDGEGCKWAWEHTWSRRLGKRLGKSHLVVGREKAEDSEESGNWGATNFRWITKDGCSHWAEKRTHIGHYCHMCAFSYWRMRLNNTCWNEILCISHMLALKTSCI